MNNLRILPRGWLLQAIKIAGLTAWLAFATWIFQSHFERRGAVAQESGWRARTEAILSRSAPAARMSHVVNGGSKTVIEADRSALETADNIDHAVRHLGLDHVGVVAGNRESLYWTIFELVRRGYDEDEILVLLGQPENAPDGC
jgi:hypothetical protein